MKHSTERILTTHVGSLPRPPELLDITMAKVTGQPYDKNQWAEKVRVAVMDVVRRQAEAGVDIVNDGELSKPNWVAYVNERLSGFGDFRAGGAAAGGGGAGRSQERTMFKEYFDEWNRIRPFRDPLGQVARDAVCTGPVSYVGQAPFNTDVTNLKAALAEVKVEEAFIPAAAPGGLANRKNQYYPTQEAFLYAISDAMRVEYKAVVDAGFVLSIDYPGLQSGAGGGGPSTSGEEHWKRVGPQVEALNHALAGIPEGQIRFHVCWGGGHGPHTDDIPLKYIMPSLLKIRASGYLVEASNARHEHEWKVWQDVKLPEGKILMPGVVSHATNHIEHPELVAQRLERYAAIVGRENVVASTDCGLGPRLHYQLAWAKLRAMADGAALATKELWRK